MEKLIEMLQNSKYCIALTGAGISTLSGIRDFRGKNGIYKDFDANIIFDINYFQKDPTLYYETTKDIIYSLDKKKPGIVHTELTRLENLGIVKNIITQNIDLLHAKAGSTNVIELHGSPRTHHCMDCGQIFQYEYIASIVNSGMVPWCDLCHGIIKPDIVFYGELLEPDKLDAAIAEASKADLIMALGTSLLVQPAASLPLYTIEHGSLVIVNDMPTPLDEIADLHYSELEVVFRMIHEFIM
ncbi:MAG: NAD-dependent deacetylase [Fibrobacter sp.]|nr:NAD-dependent deacetylase [Fibrobacter sp.]